MPEPTQAIVIVEFTPSWVNGWFVRVFARPVVSIDGAAAAGRWSTPVERAVDDGTHRVGAGIRYVGTPWILGMRPRSFTTDPRAPLRLIARNGPLNSDPFLLRVAPTDETGQGVLGGPGTRTPPVSFTGGHPWWRLACGGLSLGLLLTAIVLSLLQVGFAQKVWDAAILFTAATTIAWGAFRARHPIRDEE